MTWTNIKSALVSGVITGLLGIAGYIIGIGDVFALDTHSLVNVFALSALTTVVSLIKSAMTTPEGTVVGVQVKEP